MDPYHRSRVDAISDAAVIPSGASLCGAVVMNSDQFLFPLAQGSILALLLVCREWWDEWYHSSGDAYTHP